MHKTESTMDSGVFYDGEKFVWVVPKPSKDPKIIPIPWEETLRELFGNKKDEKK